MAFKEKGPLSGGLKKIGGQARISIRCREIPGLDDIHHPHGIVLGSVSRAIGRAHFLEASADVATNMETQKSHKNATCVWAPTTRKAGPGVRLQFVPEFGLFFLCSVVLEFSVDAPRRFWRIPLPMNVATTRSKLTNAGCLFRFYEEKKGLLRF